MIGGSIVVAACLLVLGWTSELVGVFVKNEEQVRVSWDSVVCGDAGFIAAGLMVELRRKVACAMGNSY